MVRRATTTQPVPERPCEVLRRRQRAVFQIYMPLSMYQRIRKLAAAHRRTASDYGMLLIQGVRPVKYIYKAANGCGIMFGAPS